MAKKKIELTKEALDNVMNSIYGRPDYSGIADGDEGSIDARVQAYLKDVCGYDESVIKGHKTGNKKIDSNFPAPRGSGSGQGKPDVMIYNLYGKKEVSVIVEDKAIKAADSKTSTIRQAKLYTTNPELPEECRVIIGNHPDYDLDIKVKVDDDFKTLKINGEEIKGFIGKDLLDLIYENPNYNEFVLTELVEKPFTQSDFHSVINNLKTLYRQIPEIQNNDTLSINFTVAFIALKMIAVKTGNKWTELKSVADVLKLLDDSVGNGAQDMKIREKYKDVFEMKDRNGKTVVFDFKEIIESINAREQEEHRINGRLNNNYESVIMKIHDIIRTIPDDDVPVDLFGEVYECLANSGTKKELGQFFTRRHIIKAIVRMFFSEDDIENIVNSKKTIGDCCCGTGGFLTESFIHIKDYYERENGSTDGISDLASEIIVGYDIDASNIGRTRVNMTLAGDGFSDIKRVNTLTAPLSDNPMQNSGEIRKNMDFILTNVPYGKGDFAYTGVDPETDYEYLRSNNIKRLELNFVLKIIDMLKDGGRASIIVPEGLLEAPSLASFREYLLEKCRIDAIISLPPAAFAPYTKWKTYVIFITKRRRPLKNMEEVISMEENIWCYIVDNDGYANSDKRFRTGLTDENGKWLHDELSHYKDNNNIDHPSLIEQCYDAKREDKEMIHKDEWGNPIVGKKYGKISIKDITKKQITVYDTVDEKTFGNLIKAEADNNTILSKEEHKILTSILNEGKKGYSKPKIKDFVDEDGNIIEGLEDVLNNLGLQYNSDEKKMYDLNSEHIIYSLPLVPEKYFRNEQKELITLEELKDSVSAITSMMNDLFNGGDNDDNR